MPTKRPRITITETPAVARRLNLVAARMPEARSRAQQLLALTELGEQVLLEHASEPAGGDGRAQAKAFILRFTGAITPEQTEAMLVAREAEWAREIY